MTKPKNWQEIFTDAAKWPALRIAYWKSYGGTGHNQEAKFYTTQLLRKMGKPEYNLRTISLTRDLVWAISKLSVELDPAFLFEQVVAARMPFQYTLFEWKGEDRRQVLDELKIRQEQLAEHPDSEVPSITVYDTNGEKQMHFWSYEHEKKNLCMFPIVVFVNGNGVADNNPTLQMLGLYEGAGNFIASWMFTTNVLQKHPDAINLVKDERVKLGLRGPIFAASSGVRNPAALLMAGTAGEFRWFGALCALLNRPGNVRYVDAPPPDPSQTPAKGPTRAQDGQSRPQVLTLMLPRDKTVTRLLRAVEQDRKKVGLHEVMGHWAYRHRELAQDCHHVWPSQPTRRQVCETCGQVRWWMPQHNRGEGDTLKTKQRRADFTGQSVNRLVESIKQENEK